MKINYCIDKILEYLASEADSSLELTYGDCRILVYGTKSGSNCAGEIHFANNLQFDRWANSCTIMLNSFNFIGDGSFPRVLKSVIGIYA